MRSIRHQSGASLITWLILASLVGVVGIVALKLTPVYIQMFTVQSILESVATEPGVGKEPKRVVWDKISKRLDVNEVDDVKFENFEIKVDDRGAATFSIKYEVRKPLLGNVDAVVKFDKSVKAN